MRFKTCFAAFVVSMALVAVAKTNYVNCALADYTNHDGTSWEKAFKTIQEGVNAAVAGDTVLVAPGDYAEGGARDSIKDGGLSNRVLIANKSITLKSVAGAAATRIIGQYDRDTLEDATCPGLGDNAVRGICVVAGTASEAPVIQGFTVADGATAAVENRKECSKNTAGGIQVYSASSGQYTFHGYIVDCVVTNCIAARAGGIDGGRVIRCRVEDCDSWNGNSAGVRHSSLFNSLIVRNGRRKNSAGAVEYVFPDVGGVIVNCTFSGNAGRAIGNYPGTVYNCLFSENGDAGLGANGTPTFGNCLVDANGTAPNATCIKPANNFQLLAPAVGDYRLLPTSAAVGAGDVSALDLIPEAYRDKDFYGNPRTTGGTVNIGCSETPTEAPQGGAVIFSFKASVNGFVGYCDKLHAYSASYPEMFDVAVAPGVYTDETMYFSGNANGLTAYADRWFPKWDDGRVGILSPPSSFIEIVRSAAAKVFWVQDGYAGDDSNGTSSKPYATIQDAVTAAGTAKTIIKVCPGVYATGGAQGGGHSSDGSTQMNRVALAGNQMIRIVSTGGPSVTTILGAEDDSEDGDEWGCSTNSYRCVCMSPSNTGYPQALQGFTLSGGRAAYYAGGAYLYSGAVVADCIITNCISARAAGAYRGRLERCWIVDNYITDSYKGSSYNYNDIVEQGVYSSCVFSSNRVANLKSTHPITGMSGTMVHCSGIDSQTNYATDSNVIQANCIWDSFASATPHAAATAADRKGYGNFAIRTPVSNNSTGQFTLTGSPLARTLPYCRIYAESPAIYGGDSGLPDYFKYATLDFEGQVIRFKDGKPTAGAFQCPLPSVIALTSGTTVGGISHEGTNAVDLVTGETITFSATKVGQRPFLGIRVDGELLEGVSSYDWTVPSIPCYAPLRIEAVYGTNWYVKANGGDDSRNGSSWDEARQTLEGVMTNAVDGDVVTAAPGVYNAGKMMHSPFVYGSASVYSRVVVPVGVTLRSEEGPENTFIVGAPSLTPVDDYGSGPGAMRCVFLDNRARLCGFTVTGGRIDRNLNDTTESDLNRGAGVYCRVDKGSACAEDCIISNNVAVRGGGCYMGYYKRCRIIHNRAFVNGAAFRNARMLDCLVDYNTGAGTAGYICWGFVNSIFGAHNVNESTSSAPDLYGFTSKESPMANSVILAGKVDGFSYASNTLYTSAAAFTGMGTPIGNTCRQVASSELQFDALGRPAYGCAAIDAGNAALRGADAGDLDMLGGQRIYNGTIDAGCCEFDWRPVYASTIGGGRASVEFASPRVVRRADGKAVSLVDGTSLEVSTSGGRQGAACYELKVEVSGGGTLSVLRGGEPFQMFTAGVGAVAFSGEDVESLTFSFSGDGVADILSFRSPFGMRVIIR